MRPRIALVLLAAVLQLSGMPAPADETAAAAAAPATPTGAATTAPVTTAPATSASTEPSPVAAPSAPESPAAASPPTAPAETPSPAATAAQVAEPAVAPATQPAAAPVAAPASAAVPTAASYAPAILVLPAEFTVFQHSTVAIEPVPAWTEDAKRFLTESARRVLGTDNRFKLVEVPQLPPDQLAVLREHIELFKLIGSQIEGVVKPGGKVWKDTRENADYRIGNGLAFLHQQTGAKYAFVLAGAEIRQTGGSIFMQMLLAGLTGVYSVGAGTYMYAGVIDLDSGRLVWFGSLVGMQSMGISSGPDARKAGGADAAVSKMLVAYPGSIGLNLGAVASP